MEAKQGETTNQIALKEDNQMLMWLHLSQLLSLFTGFGGLIAPIIIWQVKKDEIINMDEQGKEVVNFQISLILYAIISGILALVLIGFALLIIVAIIGLILPIINGIKANNGQKDIRYPLTIRFIK